jgi:hypothetical protein
MISDWKYVPADRLHYYYWLQTLSFKKLMLNPDIFLFLVTFIIYLHFKAIVLIMLFKILNLYTIFKKFSQNCQSFLKFTVSLTRKEVFKD